MPNNATPPLILTIDDEVDIRKLIARTLEPMGYRTIAAASGDEGLALAAKEHPVLVLLDLKMPGLSGLETLERLKRDEPDIAVVMVSGQGDVESAVHAMSLGAIDYLVKPFKLNELVQRVAAALESRRLTLENREYHQRLEQMVAEKTEHLEQKIES